MAKDKKKKESEKPKSEPVAEVTKEAQAPTTEDESQKDTLPLEDVPKGQMFIKVYSPFRHYYEGLGASISAANDTGPFDILAGHHRFLTLLSTCELDIRTADGTEVEKIKIDRGIMYVKEDRVTVFLDV